MLSDQKNFSFTLSFVAHHCTKSSLFSLTFTLIYFLFLQYLFLAQLRYAANGIEFLDSFAEVFYLKRNLEPVLQKFVRKWLLTVLYGTSVDDIFLVMSLFYDYRWPILPYLFVFLLFQGIAFFFFIFSLRVVIMQLKIWDSHFSCIKSYAPISKLELL
jgi:hypothetical protein